MPTQVLESTHKQSKSHKQEISIYIPNSSIKTTNKKIRSSTAK
jgi:hypothetical protein